MLGGRFEAHGNHDVLQQTLLLDIEANTTKRTTTPTVYVVIPCLSVQCSSVLTFQSQHFHMGPSYFPVFVT